MTDRAEISQILAGLLETDAPDAFDWDTSALADWPNIAPAPISPAELPAADFDRAS